MTEHGIEMQRTQGPFDLAICTQKQNIGIPHAKIGRFRTTWSSASMLKPVQVRVCRCAAFCLSLLRLSTGLRARAVPSGGTGDGTGLLHDQERFAVQ